jgi:hypothetical protein
MLTLATAAIPLIFGMEIMIVFVPVIMERMGIAGHLSVVLADVVVGALCGLAVLACTCGAMLPLIAYSISGDENCGSMSNGRSYLFINFSEPTQLPCCSLSHSVNLASQCLILHELKHQPALSF